MERNAGIPAVILAAGRGERLAGAEEQVPKPLVEVLGLSLVERAILACREAGVGSFYVVTGHASEQVGARVREIGLRNNIEITVLRSTQWERGNGVSLLAAETSLAGPFLVTMCDHLLDPVIVRRLLQHADGLGDCALGVDYRLDRVIDLAEATKVRIDGRGIVAIGKRLDSFDAVDTGVLLCQPRIFDALRAAAVEGNGSLAGGLRKLIQAEALQAVDIGDGFWTDVDTPESLAAAEQRLMDELPKRHGDGIVSRRLNRPLSLRLTARLARTSVTPNALTVASFLGCLCGAFLFSLGRYPWTIAAGLVTHLASVLDGSDGEIARLKFQSSPFGAWFDTVLDRYGDAAIVAGITYGHWLTHRQPLTWLGGMLAIAGFILYSYAAKEYQLRYGGGPDRRAAPAPLPVSRDVRLFIIVVGSLLNRPFEAMVLAGLLSHAAVALRFATVRAQGRGDA